MDAATRECQEELRGHWAKLYKELLPISRATPVEAIIVIGIQPAKSRLKDVGKYCMEHGDLDNRIKSIFDSMLNLVLEDDCCIVRLSALQYYSSENFCDIRLTEIGKRFIP
jgi:Holliday junction resolvase RusA-like endonuclease